MNVLDRVTVLAALRAFLAGQQSIAGLADWAFEQFYAEAEGRLAYEAGYHRILAQTLDDVMFGDDPHFKLTSGEVEQLIGQLEAATYRDDSETDDDELEDEESFDDVDE